MTTLIVDNTVLSNFAHVSRPELLQLAFDELVIPPAVSEELAEGERLNRIPTVDWNWLVIVELTPDEKARADQLEQILDFGEAECIAIAQSRNWIVLTDDRDARRAAQSVGIAISGTLGALINLVKRGTLTHTQADAGYLDRQGLKTLAAAQRTVTLLSAAKHHKNTKLVVAVHLLETDFLQSLQLRHQGIGNIISVFFVTLWHGKQARVLGYIRMAGDPVSPQRQIPAFQVVAWREHDIHIQKCPTGIQVSVDILEQRRFFTLA